MPSNNFDEYGDEEYIYGDEEYYIYTSDSIKDMLGKLKKKLSERMDPNFNYDLWLEEFSFYDHPNDVKKRNMDKFDRLTDKGYKLNFLTGQFTLSS